MIYVLLLVTIVFCVSHMLAVSGLQQSVRRLERKLDLLLQHLGVELPSGVSPQVRLLAADPRNKIAAIKLHREQNPGLGLAEAKSDVENCLLGDASGLNRSVAAFEPQRGDTIPSPGQRPG